MAKKSYIVIGIGKFGLYLVKTLAHTNIEVMAIDIDPKKLEPVTNMVTDAVCADASDNEVLKGLGVKNFDGAIVTVGRNLQSSVMITMQLKEMGLPFVMAKANSDLEGRILTKIGADKIVYPEREMGIHIGNQLAYGNLFSSIELTEEYSITDFNIPESWIGKTIRDLNVRAKHGISIIGIRDEQGMNVNPDASTPLGESDVLVILGDNNKIKALREKFQ